MRLHGLRIGPDSLSGIPFLKPIECDSCRVSIARAEVDSIRAGDPPGGFWATTIGILVVLAVVSLYFGNLGEGAT